MIYLELFIGFLKVGCFSFGGAYAAIPLIRDIVLSYGWIDEELLSYMIAVSESTPGPIMVNLATYVGTNQAGALGAGIATFAVVLPSFLIVLLVSAIFMHIIRHKYVQGILRGVKPCMIGIVTATGCAITLKNLMGTNQSGSGVHLDLKALIITVILCVVYFGSRGIHKLYITNNQKNKGRSGLSPIALVVISALCGILFYGI